jgi:tRNA A58 N-methylase Trm61
MLKGIAMSHHVCPWWIGYLLASPLRRLFQNPHELLASYMSEGMTVLEPGPGMGFFTLDLARLVGSSGRVIVVEVQPKMLSVLARKAQEAGLSERIIMREPRGDSMAIGEFNGQDDFV